jgi:lysophospholipase L1-like esterase
MAATGDSITRAFNTGSIQFTDAPTNSWATGSSGLVHSYSSRIAETNPAVSGRSYNNAVSGGKMADLKAQMTVANGQHVDLVTVLMGGNDACAPTEEAMTQVGTFRAQFEEALDTLSEGSPDARVLVLSVPNVKDLWAILHDNSSARAAWSKLGVCQSMLANAGSMAKADVERRARVEQRVIEYNTQLAEVCAMYVRCRFDGNAVFNTEFAAGDVSTRDYFHPSLGGQAKLAGVVSAAGFDFSDRTPPTSRVATQETDGEGTVKLRLDAADGAGVAGIEYRIGEEAIARYEGGEVTVRRGTTMMYRAVDVNGNVEGWHLVSAPK